jgi:hypothetical protein
MKKTIALLALVVGSTLTLNASASSSLEFKCKVNYSQGEINSEFFRHTKQTVTFSNHDRNHSERCKKATNKLIKKANVWLKGSPRDADGAMQRIITSIQPIECKVEHEKGFMWLWLGYGAYKECGDKYDNKFKNKLIKKL